MDLIVARTINPYGSMSFFEPLGTLGYQVEQSVHPHLEKLQAETREDDEAYEVVLHTPRIEAEDIKVEVDDDERLLTLSGVLPVDESLDAATKWLIKERGGLEFNRVFKLPDDAIVTEVKATLVHEQLYVRIAKDLSNLDTTTTRRGIYEVEPMQEAKEVPLLMTAAVTQDFNPTNPTAGVQIVQSYPGPTKIKPNEVVVKMDFASVNHIDYMKNSGKFWFGPKAPFVGGTDGVGTIIELGERAQKVFNKQEVVVGVTDHHFGTFGQYAVFKMTNIARKPERISLEHAAAMPTAMLTAHSVFLKIKQPSTLKRVLIHGGSGGVGSWLVLFAKYLYNIKQVIATCSSKSIDYVKSLGADHVIDYTTEEFDTVINNMYRDSDKAPVDAVLDTVGGDDILHRSYQLLDSDGYLITTVTLTDFDHKSMPEEVIGFGVETLKNKISHMLGTGPNFYGVKHITDGHVLEKLMNWAVEHKVQEKIEIVKYPLNELPTALYQIHSMHTDGKMIIDMSY